MFLFINEFASAFHGGELDLCEYAGRLIGAHDGEFGAGPGISQEGVVSAAAHGVISCAVTVADDECDFGGYAVRHGVDHFGAAAEDSADSCADEDELEFGGHGGCIDHMSEIDGVRI